MRPLVARLVVFACAIVALAALVPIAEGYLWVGYGVQALAILGALKATAHVPDDGLRYGVLFAVFAYLSVSAHKPISNGLTARHFAAFAVAATVLRAFVGLAPLQRWQAPVARLISQACLEVAQEVSLPRRSATACRRVLYN